MKTEILKTSLNIQPNERVIANCQKFIDLFAEYNSHTNLMSKNDLKVIFEKHIVDSLSINLFKGFSRAKKILDIGTGGGFPSLPISVFFEDKEVTAVDSIRKKIRFIEQVKDELKLDNLTPICSRIEELNDFGKFDIVTSRALSDLEQIIRYALPFLKKKGYIVAYKSKTASEELRQAKDLIKKSNLLYLETINYSLELEESYERCLVILQKQ